MRYSGAMELKKKSEALDPADSPAVPLLDLSAQHGPIREELRAAIDRVIDSDRFILGPEVERFEREMAQYSRCHEAIGVSSGTDALLVSMMACGIGPDDEVIAPTFTFFATAGSIARTGARPVFADIDPLTYNIDPQDLERRITAKTKAIIPVHLYGQMADMAGVSDVARRHGLIVIEDAAQAVGAEYHGHRAGTMGQLGCLSFFPSKNLGAMGDGGMVLSDDAERADRVRLLRTHGYRPKYYNSVVGGNFRLDALQAAILRVKLAHLDRWTAARQQNAQRYRDLLEQAGLVVEPGADLRAGGVVLPLDAGHGRHVYNQFVIRCARRDELRAQLQERRIGSEIYYPVPMHVQQCFDRLGYQRGDFPQAEQAAAETVALPIYPGLEPTQQQAVVQAIADLE
jgi:dTDP-4-amino-4,6-dideoxygalactose transaminase